MADILGKLGTIEAGMKRETVASILGPHHKSLSPEGHPPVCDSFLYKDEGQVRYIHVWYKDGVVDRTTAGNRNVAGIV